jgi:uncharacterized protein YcbK (DUF882 family)
MPDINSLDNLLTLIVECLQPIRDKIKKPIVITSGYRNSQVNKLVGGSNTSQHAKGQAVDFVIKGMTPKQIIDFIRKSGVKYTQLIEEYANNTSWVHIGYDPKNLKCETLLYKNGIYTKQ